MERSEPVATDFGYYGNQVFALLIGGGSAAILAVLFLIIVLLLFDRHSAVVDIEKQKKKKFDMINTYEKGNGTLADALTQLKHVLIEVGKSL